MARKKKKFIDPKIDRTTTFSLVHRSQRDPLAADPDAPQRVLQAVDDDQVVLRKQLQKEEERKFGVFYEDDYNYMQHLKDREAPEYDFSEFDKFASNSGINLDQLPSEVFATRGREEAVGLLNKAAPQSGPRLDWDPDIVETLDDEFQHERVYSLEDARPDGDDELDEIFRAAITGEGVEGDESEPESEPESDFSSDFGGRSEGDEVPELHRFMAEETKSRFTSYSMSSSVIRRNEQLALLDGKFENFFVEYDDIAIGGLETEDIEGRLNTEVDKDEEETPGDLVMSQILEGYRKDKEDERQGLPEVVEKFRYETRDDKAFEEEEEETKDDFDCQSILSTYSNMYNRPKLIRISGRTGMPKDVLGKGLTASALKRLDRGNDTINEDEDETRTLASRMSELSFRNKHETPEEKKARKQAMKAMKRERRAEKKLNRNAFQKEQKRQEKQNMNQKPTIKIL